MFHIQNLLTFFLFSPLLVMVSLIFFSETSKKLAPFALISSSFIFISSLFLLLLLDPQNPTTLQYTIEFFFLKNTNLIFSLAFDALGLVYIALTAFLIFICILTTWNTIKEKYRLFLILLFGTEFLLFLVFSAMDLIFFYIFFECLLIPLFIMIGKFGSGDRKIRAGYLFFFYTFVGSLVMLFSILYIYTTYGSTNYEYLLNIPFTFTEEKFLWLGLFISFAIKLPLFPFHVWLPEAHVEAPTSGSILLAGILLKMGVYGIIRFVIPLFPAASIYYTPLIVMLSLLGIVYTSLTAIRQVDLKRIIAYTSVAHMNLVLLALFSFSTMGFMGAMFQSVSHGFVASALFMLVGVIYDRFHNRFIQSYSGLTIKMPLFITFFLFFSLANIAFPLTSSFVGEFLILFGIYSFSIPVTIFASVGMILGGGYSLWLLNRIGFGNLKANLTNAIDLDGKEFFSLAFFTFFVLLLGIYPKVFFNLFKGFFSMYLII
jgi:NADH-quinone oxidoreductase subunit M